MSYAEAIEAVGIAIAAVDEAASLLGFPSLDGDKPRGDAVEHLYYGRRRLVQERSRLYAQAAKARHSTVMGRIQERVGINRYLGR